MSPRITALCPSYNRPKLLGNAIAMFESQNIGDAELIVLEDSGVFQHDIVGKNWRIVVSSTRFQTTGLKRNAMVDMARSEFLAVMDDDDIYFPNWLSATADALEMFLWVQPRQALEWDAPGVLGRYFTHGKDRSDFCYGGQWSYRKSAFKKTPGYPNTGNGDDSDFVPFMNRYNGKSGDTLCPAHPKPFYVYQRDESASWHVSEMGPGHVGFKAIQKMPLASPSEFKVELPPHYDAPIPDEVKERKW